MRKRNAYFILSLLLILCFLMAPTALATSESTLEPIGYIYNPDTGALKPYYFSPQECLPVLAQPEQTMTDSHTAIPIPDYMPRAIIRTFHSYSPTSYTYSYNNSRFKIGFSRVDNTRSSQPTDLIFKVEKSGSCSMAITSGITIGGEMDAIYAKAKAEFGAEVTTQISWTSGQSSSTGSKVPAGQIGKVTAYVVGMYSNGTARYTLENPATGTIQYENVGIGAIIPTTNGWNFVIEIPSE